tara:strand:- start:4345 stop:4578 length:234 start_codon:yes stop_codon:yes gene_type:complete
MKSAKMSTIMQIDGIGKRYGMLPSQVISEADTFDLYIMDAAMSFEHYHHKKQNSKNGLAVPDYSQEELQEILGKKKK